MKNLSNKDGFETPAVCGSSSMRVCTACGQVIDKNEACIDVTMGGNKNAYMHSKCAKAFAQEILDCVELEENMPAQNRRIINVLRLRKMSRES